MRKFFFTCLFWCTISLPLYAQDNSGSNLSTWYARAGVGYGIGINGDYWTDIITKFPTSISTNVTTTKLGNAICGNIWGGYQYNSNLGAELGIGYGSGLTNNAMSDPNISTNLTGNIMQAVPTIVFSTRAGFLRLYLKTGLIIGLPEVFEEQIRNKINPDSLIVEKTKYTGNIATGFFTALGLDIPLKNRRWNFFAEASFSNIGYAPARSELYSATAGPEDVLSTVPEFIKETIYKQSGPYYKTGSIDQPSYAPARKMSFGSFCINAGVKLNIGELRSYEGGATFSDRFYIRLGAGYGFPVNGDFITLVAYPPSSQPGEISKVDVYSNGSGFNASIGAGYRLTPNFGFDLGLNEVISSVYKTGNPGSGLYYPLASQYGDMLQVNPSMVFSTNIGRFCPYTRLGLLVGFGNVYQTLNDPHNPPNSLTVWKYYGGTALGYNAVLGISYPLSKVFSVFAEACFNNIYDIPQKGEMIVQTYNGVSNLNKDYPYEKEIIFKSSFQSPFNINLNEPAIDPLVKYSFNALVASAGIKMWL